MDHYDQTQVTISGFFDLLSEFHTRYLDLFEHYLLDVFDFHCERCDRCPQTPLSQTQEETPEGKF
jgi:hypothetical protein